MASPFCCPLVAGQYLVVLPSRGLHTRAGLCGWLSAEVRFGAAAVLRNGKREARDASRWHHDELGTAKDEPFGLLRRSLGVFGGKNVH